MRKAKKRASKVLNVKGRNVEILTEVMNRFKHNTHKEELSDY